MYSPQIRCMSGLLTMALVSCQTVGVVGYPAEYVATKSPSHVWVTKSDNSVVELSNPQLHEDTLTGFSAGSYTEMPISDVKLMKGPFAAPARTALLAGVTAVGVALAVSALMGNGKLTQTTATCTTSAINPIPAPCVALPQ
jgi:hypothetical protein